MREKVTASLIFKDKKSSYPKRYSFENKYCHKRGSLKNIFIRCKIKYVFVIKFYWKLGKELNECLRKVREFTENLSVKIRHLSENRFYVEK